MRKAGIPMRERFLFVRRRGLGVCFVALFALLAGCRTPPLHTVTQLSTIDAILAGAYDGQMTCGELLSHGDFGIGTFEGLDGEMVVLDGDLYQVRADGHVYRPGRDLRTPFASVVKFDAPCRAVLPAGSDLRGLEAQIAALAPNSNVFCAIRVDGDFRVVKARSVPAQAKPYPPLAEVTRTQPVFELEKVSGTLVGFRSPAFARGINVPGLHLHFLTADRTAGGHVLECVVEKATVRLEVCDRFLLILPADDSAFRALDLGRDRSDELDRAER